jgi:Flavodoxin domain
MRTAVVYESWFGNTRKVAEAVARELGQHGDVLQLSVDDPVPSLEQIDLLVVGAPTHVHGLSNAMSRRSALEQRGDGGETGIGVRGWLRALPPTKGQRAAAFDTRIEKSTILVGSAARGIAKRLEHRGFALVVAPESFFVLDAEGPLKDGELARAADWAASLVPSSVAATAG